MIGKLFVGLDLGQRFHQVAVINAAMELVVEPFRIKRGREGIEALMERVKGQGAGPEDVVVTIAALREPIETSSTAMTTFLVFSRIA